MTLLYVAGGIAVLLAASLFIAQRRARGEALLPSDAAIARAAREGQWTLAIRSYRVLHGAGLRHAKERVEALAAHGSLIGHEKPTTKD